MKLSRKQCLQEARVCKDVAEKLAPVLKRAKAAAEKEQKVNNDKIDGLMQIYGTIEDAQEAYGYGSITRKEFEMIQDRYSEVEQNEEASHKRAVYEELQRIYNRVKNTEEYWKKEAEISVCI